MIKILLYTSEIFIGPPEKLTNFDYQIVGQNGKRGTKWKSGGYLKIQIPVNEISCFLIHPVDN